VSLRVLTLARRFGEADLGGHCLFTGMTRHGRHPRQSQLRAPSLRVQRRQDEDSALLALKDLSSAARGRIVEVGKRDVAAHFIDPDDGPVGRIALDLSLELFAETVLGDERDEGQWVVDRQWCRLVPIAEPS
jgi:hypothetical protein